MSENYTQLVEVMLDGSDSDFSEQLILEAEEEEVLSIIEGDRTSLSYMLLLEALFDQLDIYIYKGWEDAKIISSPIIQKFWVTFDISLPPSTDSDGVSRLRSSLKQSKIHTKKQSDGSTWLHFEVLRRVLDRIEKDDQTKIEELTVAALGDLG